MSKLYTLLTNPFGEEYAPIAATTNKSDMKKYISDRDTSNYVELVINLDHPDCPEDILNIAKRSDYYLDETIIDLDGNPHPATAEELDALGEIASNTLFEIENGLNILDRIMSDGYIKFSKEDKQAINDMILVLEGIMDEGRYIIDDYCLAVESGGLLCPFKRSFRK